MPKNESFEAMLMGGHPNSLGRTIEVVDQVLEKPVLFDELFHCYFSQDELVRLRVSNAMKRIAKENKEMVLPYVDRFLEEVSQIDQASTQWTLAQLFLLLQHDLSLEQKRKALVIMKNNVGHHEDWIVLSQSMETLGRWARKDRELKIWLLPHLERLGDDSRKSVSKKAKKTLELLKK